MCDELLVLLVIILLFTGFIAGGVKVSQLECTSKAKALGYKCEWGIWQGCVLEKPNGDKILLEKLRYNELD